jgi:hypothetical protein
LLPGGRDLWLFDTDLPALCRIAGRCFPPNKKPWEDIMTTSLTFPDPQHRGGGFDRRKMLTGAAALAASAVTMKAATAATVTPLGQTGAPTPSSEPLPLGPLTGGRYPDSHLESLKKP